MHHNQTPLKSFIQADATRLPLADDSVSLATTESKPMPEMKIKAIAGWFGGKRTMAPLIVKQLGEHVQYFEPFCGSMAVLFAKKPSPHETVNDLHQDLINLAMVLQDRESAIDLYERTMRTLFSESALDMAEAVLADPWEFVAGKGDRERAYWYFLATWMGRNGVAGTAATDYQLAVRWTANGGTPTTRFRSCTDSIPAWHERLKNVVILRRDAFDIIPKFDDREGVSIYIDSPYTSDSRSGSLKGGHCGTYLHEFNHESDMFACDDHARLRDQLQRFQNARVVVSHYDCDRVRKLYSGWTFIDCARMKNIHQQNGRGQRQKEAPEVLIVNGDEYR